MKLRHFQKEIIDEIDLYLQDQTIHVVAPPGAGKTILGVEIARKLQKRTLILVPSLVLKNQWLNYLTTTFEPQNVSQDILEPKLVTITTYQTFHLQHSAIANNCYEFLIMDEAHHLKKIWADELLAFKKRQPALQSLSLTATPPYDATTSEWKRYIELNGLIDVEISPTQLIKEDVLSPYQDYVHLIPESSENEAAFLSFLQTQNEIIETLTNNQEVTDVLLNLEFIGFPLENTAFIYEHFDIYLSVLSYLHEQGWEVNAAHWEVLGLTKYKNKVQLPYLTRERLCKLYQFLFELQPKLGIFDYLKAKQWLYQESLHMFPPYKDSENYRSIPLKKESIAQIVVKEEAFLGEQLCAVLFVDRIKEDTLFGQDPYLEFGVAPLFLFLKELLQPTTHLTAICGKFCLLPRTLAEQLLPTINRIPLERDSNYVYLSLTDENRSQILTEVTAALNRKQINLLIGTISFLGEGWDCASINTVILGNTSSSYVQTQQLRGRGLRKAPGKHFANIWHLATVYKNIDLEAQVEFQTIAKRLSFISGLNGLEKDSKISTGIERFDLPVQMTEDTINSYNANNFYWAQRRVELQEKWTAAIEKGTRQMLPLLLRPDPNKRGLNEEGLNLPASRIFKKKNFYVNRFLHNIFRNLRIRRAWKNYCKQLELFVTTIFYLLQEDGILAKESRLRIQKADDLFLCELEQATFNANTMFNQQIAEVMREIEAPRYLLKLNQLYFSVPSYFNKNKKDVLRLEKALKDKTKTVAVFYTKNVAGRKALMEAYLQQSSREVVEEKIWS